MAGTDLELNRPLKLTRFDPSDVALAESQALYREPDGKFAGLSENTRGNLALGSGVFFVLTGLLTFATFSMGIFAPAPLIILGSFGALFVWATVPALRWHSRMEKSKKRVSKKIWSTRDELNSWLLETYGLQFENIMVSERLAESLLKLGPAIGPQEEFTMHTLGGMRIQARFELTDGGLLEVKKTNATDSTESPYFTPIREELS